MPAMKKQTMPARGTRNESTTPVTASHTAIAKTRPTIGHAADRGKARARPGLEPLEARRVPLVVLSGLVVLAADDEEIRAVGCVARRT